MSWNIISRFANFCFDRPSFGREVRAQSYVIGTILLLAISVVATAGLFVAGLGFLNSSQAQLEAGSATQSFQQLGSEASMVAFGDAARRHVELGLQNPSEISTNGDGVFRVQTLNESNGTVEQTLTEQRLGALEYEISPVGQSETRTVVYQSGGVWVQHNGDTNATAVSTMPRMGSRLSTFCSFSQL